MANIYPGINKCKWHSNNALYNHNLLCVKKKKDMLSTMLCFPLTSAQAFLCCCLLTEILLLASAHACPHTSHSDLLNVSYRVSVHVIHVRKHRISLNTSISKT